jgi:hypothetical protein
MTRRDELLALAARVEAAQGADRELDGEISRAIGTPGWRLSDAGRWFQSCLRRAQFAPTSSLDAAVSLVPEGWEWAAGINTPGYFRDGCAGWARVFPRSRQDQGTGNRYATTPALALTAAALRALAEEAGHE